MARIKTIQERYDASAGHLPASIELYQQLAKIDFNQGDYFCFKSGGDGDNGEHLMYLLDVYFDSKEKQP